MHGYVMSKSLDDCCDPKHSQGKDYQITNGNRRGRVHEEEANRFTPKDKAENGLTTRQPL